MFKTTQYSARRQALYINFERIRIWAVQYYSLFVYFCRTLTKNFLKSTKPIDTRFSGQPNINKNPPKIYFLSLSGGWLINYYISLVIINNSFIMFTVTICQRRIVLIPKALPVLFGGGKSDFGYKRKGCSCYIGYNHQIL